MSSGVGSGLGSTTTDFSRCGVPTYWSATSVGPQKIWMPSDLNVANAWFIRKANELHRSAAVMHQW